jgi:hypothetical protein
VIGVVDDITTTAAAAAAADWDEVEEDDTWYSFDGTNDDDDDDEEEEEDDDSVSTAPEATTFAHFEDMYVSAFDNVEASDDNLLDETENTIFDLPVIPIYHSGVHEITDDRDDDDDDDLSWTTSSDSVLMFDDSEASDDDDGQEEKDFVDILALVALLKLDWNECTGEIINDEKVTCKELLEDDISGMTFDQEASEDDLEEKDYFDMLVELLNLDWNESAGGFNNENATCEELLEDNISVVTFGLEASVYDPEEWKDYFDLLVGLVNFDESPEEITNLNINHALVGANTELVDCLGVFCCAWGYC